ncbi:hypothetical protein LENED_011924 [Lentinula edodes]|uniref:Uncharacterized protein n=1 Tax=Lentinula edodes TaxID=5353 RepID=A0A1Q3ERA5_LENED|nr:hypothetical protein LENED_011924 [Lentinula edodes]
MSKTTGSANTRVFNVLLYPLEACIVTSVHHLLVTHSTHLSVIGCKQSTQTIPERFNRLWSATSCPNQ